MKLRNKNTGEVIDLDIANIKAQFGGISVIPEPAVLSSPEYVYTSLAELCAEWEDVPEPKVGYIIDPMEEDYLSEDDSVYEESDVERAKELGIWFETEEEARRAVEKLKAFKRLKDKGLRFDGYDVAHKSNGNLAGQIFYDAGNYSIEDVEKEMDLLFSEVKNEH